MKIMILVLLFLSTNVSAKADLEAFKKAKDCAFCMSMQRTGTNWTLASLEYLTGRKVQENLMRIPSTKFNIFKAPMYVSHYPAEIALVCKKKNKLIMLIRDYREVLLRYAKTNPDAQLVLKNMDVEKTINRYKMMIQEYENWPENNRHCVYYEDLLNNPENTFRSLLFFLNESDRKLDSFINNIDIHKKAVLDAYNVRYKRLGGAISRGTDVHYHAKDISDQDIEALDKAVMEYLPKNLWKKYLRRYTVPVSR